MTTDSVQFDAALHCAHENSRGTVVLAHGITVDMNDGGMLARLAEQLAANGFDALRFSYRGHGPSGGTQAGATIAEEVLDLQTAVEHARRKLPG